MLERLDRKMRHFEPEAMATVLCAVLSPGLDHARISCAGHLPPVIAGPGQPARTAVVAADILIGVDAGRGRRSVTIELPPGAVLCLYTDGLVERRGRVLDDGIAALCAAITTSDPEWACASAMAAMTEPGPHADDIALLLLRRETTGAVGDWSPRVPPCRGPGRREPARWPALRSGCCAGTRLIPPPSERRSQPGRRSRDGELNQASEQPRGASSTALTSP